VEALILPGGIRHLSGSAFAGTRLKTLSFSPLPMKFTVSDSIVEDISVRCLIQYLGQGDTVRIESSIEGICEGCFMWCKSVLSVVFKENSQLARLEDRAFSESGLTSIHLPASVTDIGEESFCRCDSLRSITFESGSRLSRLQTWHLMKVAGDRFISPLQSLSSASPAFPVAAHLRRSHLNPAHNYLNLQTGHFIGVA
jgi:hypothetical protein